MITCVGLSISFDKIIFLPELELDNCNRSDKVSGNLGGKAVNVASVIKQIGCDPVIVGVVGGRSEEDVKKSLEEKGLAYQLVLQKDVETRIDYIIAEQKTGRSTMITGPNFQISGGALSEIKEKVMGLAAGSSIMVFTGALPDGVPKSFFAELVLMAKEAGCITIIDSGAQELKGSLPARPDFVKPNMQELSQIVGHMPESPDEIIAAARSLLDGGAKNAVISMGAEGAVMVFKEKVLTARAPKIAGRNTIGCGDAMVAGLASRLSDGCPADEAFAYSVAVGAAAAMSESTSSLVTEEINNLLSKVTVEEIK